MEEEPSTSGGIKRSIPKELQDAMDETAAKLPRVTATPAVLDDNQKRYLIVGICLHSVISPALRKYVVPILTPLYEELSLKQKIDTQTYSTSLKQYQPTYTLLNYEAVNNNKATYGYQRAQYDYTIKSVIDLSKLFLQTHMAQYTGFDETCDSSALFGLIINIDKFPPVVKANAKDVREKVRNPWAHCDFTEWDAVKYADSFQLMMNLVKNIGLSSNEEKQTILEMKKWEKDGPSSLNGTNEICRLLHVLVKSSKLVAKETDNNSLETKKMQDYISSTLTQIKSDMETRFVEIDKRLLAIEENQDTLLDSHKVKIEYWKEQDVTFVDTPVVNVILTRMESEHSVLIVGEPGIGKSMLMHNVALKLNLKIGYTIIPCTVIKDILQHYKKDKRQIFVMDDICGRFTVGLSDIKHWMDNKDLLKIILKKGMTKIVGTCRLDIYKDKKYKEVCTVFKSGILNLSVLYSMEDKLNICRNYLSESDVQMLKDKNVDFTPQMCYLYSKNKKNNLTDFLQCSFETYQKEWDKLEVFDVQKYCSLFLCVIYGGAIKESLFDVYNKNNTKNKSAFENIFEICGIRYGTPRGTIKTVLDSLTGTYLIKTRSEYRIIHDQMFDFMCCYFGNKDAMVRCILRYSDIRVFNQRTQLKSVNENHGKFTIMISKKYEKEYFERIKSDLQLGKINQCFYNTQMKYEVYRTSFLNILKSIDDKLLTAQFYQRKRNRFKVRHADYIECDDFSDDNDYDVNDKYSIEGPFIESCLRGYYDIVQYFISKSVDRKSYDSIYSPLTAACKGGNEKIVQLLLDKGSDVNRFDGSGCTPLTAAGVRGNETIVQLLIDKGSDVNQGDGIWQTPLTAACSGGNEKIVEILIDKGIDINQIGNCGHTPLTAACRKGNKTIVQLLIDKGSDVNQEDGFKEKPLTSACIEGHQDIVQLLLEKESDYNYVDSCKYTPLTYACRRGNEKIVQLLIDKGSDVNKVENARHTPLTSACHGGNEKLLQLLIDRGCDVNQGDNVGETPLIVACGRGFLKIVQFLIGKGSEVNQKGGYGKRPLTSAISEEHEDIVNLLIDKGSEVNCDDIWNDTPLTTACRKGNVNIVQLLIDKGCKVNQLNREDRTPLSAACRIGNEKIVQLLIDKKSDVNQVDRMKQTPLTAACRGGNEKIVQLLIEKGSEVNKADDIGETPLIAACCEENYKLVQFLIVKGGDIKKVEGMKQTPLTAACSRENEEIVKFLIKKGCDVNQVDDMKQTPLTAACGRGNENIVELLIEKECDVNQVDDMKQTPLMAACRRGNEKIVKLLLDARCDTNKTNDIGQTPLSISRKTGNKKVLQLLLDI